jgi:hypothetical protein
MTIPCNKQKHTSFTIILMKNVRPIQNSVVISVYYGKVVKNIRKCDQIKIRIIKSNIKIIGNC